jgi:hypothetical protein
MVLVRQTLAERRVAWQRRRRRRIDPRRDPPPSRKAGIKVRTIMDGRGRPHAFTPDGWPAHEPWRGAAIHAHESGAMNAVVSHAPDRLLGTGDSG